MIIKQKGAPRLQHRYTYEFMNKIKQVYDDIHDIDLDYKWTYITAISDGKRYELVRDLDNIILTAKSLLYEINAMDREIL